MSYDPPVQPPSAGWNQPPQPGPLPQPPKRKRHILRKIAIGAGGVIVLIVVLSVALGHSTPSAPASGSLQSIKAHYTPAPPVATTPAAPPSPAAPQYTVSQEQAIASAKDYLSTEPGFSYLGLIGQLDSSAVGFSEADATFGVNAVAPASDTSFWDAQAAASAKDYMQTEPGWSACGLVGQLDSDAVQFTQAQAEYGAQSVGLGTC